MGFDFENIIYILGLIIWIASSFFSKKKKKKSILEKKIDPNKPNEKRIPKSFSDLVEQVKSELDKKDDFDSEVIENTNVEVLNQDEVNKDSYVKEDKKNIEINNNEDRKFQEIKVKDEYPTKSVDKKIKNQNKPNTVKEKNQSKRLKGYKIKKKSNKVYENELFNELNNEDSLKKAFLFKEILKRKYK